MEQNYTGGGGGGGKGGGADGGPAHGYGNVRANNTFMYRSGPPLTTIDKFLGSHFLYQQNQNTAKYNDGSVWSAGFGRFPCSGGAPYRFLRPNSPQEINFLDGFLASEEQNLNRMHSETPNLHPGEDIEALGKNLEGRRRGGNKKGPSESNLIKRQWSQEEDR